MTTSMGDRQPWGQQLRDYRRRTGLTQGQFIERLSFLVSEISGDDRSALEQIDVFDEAATYFSGVLDSPTLSRLEKGNRGLNSRPRCIALAWGLNRLGVLDGKDEANTFLEHAGHGNLTDAELEAVVGQVIANVASPSIEANAGVVPTEPVAESSADAKEAQDRKDDIGEGPARNWGKLSAGALVGAAALLVAFLAGSASRNSDAETEPGSDPAAPRLLSHVLLVDELESANGELGGDQTFVSLHERDQRGQSDDWLQFVKFLPDDTGAYVGYRAYHLPDHIPVDSITDIRLEVNYRGPDYEAAPWVWEADRSDTAERIRLGDNRNSLWWSDWTEETFTFAVDEDQFDATHFLRDGQIWVMLSGNRAVDTLDMDYEALVVEWVEPGSN